VDAYVPDSLRKGIEREQFARFRSLCQCGLKGSITQPEPPEPDIVVPTSNGLVGVELTAIHPNGSQSRWQESEQKELLDLAKKLYRTRGHAPINIWVHWGRSPAILRSNRSILAQRLCDLVAERCSPEWGYLEVADSALTEFGELPIAHLGFAAASSWDGADWGEGAFHRVAPLGVPEVQAFLDREDPKTRRYREVYASIWVVLLCETAGPSTWGVTVKDVWRVEFKSSFQRAFLVEIGHGTCGELKIA
jgi:hypothetical protein